MFYKNQCSGFSNSTKKCGKVSRNLSLAYVFPFLRLKRAQTNEISVITGIYSTNTRIIIQNTSSAVIKSSPYHFQLSAHQLRIYKYFLLIFLAVLIAVFFIQLLSELQYISISDNTSGFPHFPNACKA